MLKIFKYPISIRQLHDRIVPLRIKGFQAVMSVIEQNDDVAIYAMIDDTLESCEEIKVAIVGTGHPMGEFTLGPWRFLGTVSTCKGKLVWHVFVNV
jgi:hypothetical protein